MGPYKGMRNDHGENSDVVRGCRLIEDPKAAKEFTQMKGALGLWCILLIRFKYSYLYLNISVININREDGRVICYCVTSDCS